MENISKVRSFFVDNYGHVDLDQMSDGFMLRFLALDYLKDLSFERKMDFLYDHILAQNLCDVEE